MTSVKPSSAVDVRYTAKSCSSSNIHQVLNPIQSTTAGGGPQRGSDLCLPCCSPCFESPRVDWTDSLPRQAQTKILIHGPSQRSSPQGTALHAASLGRSSCLETAMPQQYLSTGREANTMDPGPFPLPLSNPPPKPSMSSMEALQSVHSQDACWHNSQSSSNHTGDLSIAPHHGTAPVEQLDLSSHGTVGSRAQSSYSSQTPDDPIQISLDLESGSRSRDEKRKRNASASARLRQRRKEKELEDTRTVAGLKQRVGDLIKICELYREERDHFYNLAKSGSDPKIAGLLTPSSGFSDQS